MPSPVAREAASGVHRPRIKRAGNARQRASAERAADDELYKKREQKRQIAVAAALTMGTAATATESMRRISTR